MKKISILTLFPEMFSCFDHSIVKRAIEQHLVDIKLYDYRLNTINKHNKVDDYPYGGGEGMVISCQPIDDCLSDIKTKNSKIVLLTPQGARYDQKRARELAKNDDIILICGHYEGIDERLLQLHDITEISIGDYIVSGGEYAAMILTDSIVRLSGVLKNENSHLNESFENNLLEGPCYTRPAVYKGLKVPEVLLNGDHAKIKEFKAEASIKKTKENRPDLLTKK